MRQKFSLMSDLEFDSVPIDINESDRDSFLFLEGLPMELLYADDLVLVAETEELLMEKLRKWKRGMELKGLRDKNEHW